MSEVITNEYLLSIGFEYDQITYSKGNILLAPFEDGYHVFLDGLLGGVSKAVKYIDELNSFIK